MKKIFIATACAFTLCLTSCASKNAPETESQTQAPQFETESSETAGTDAASENTDTSETEETSETAENSGNNGNTESDAEISSENFPEPEEIEEPDVITLEPVDEPVPAEPDTTSEEVENEEPPVIAENQATEENANDETTVTKIENSIEDTETTTDTDIIINSDSDDDGISAIGGGIDITDDDSDSAEEYNEAEKEIIPSRSVTLKKFEYLDVTYPGTGWIYMGLTDNSKDVAYFGRKLGTKDTKFTLQARTAGTKIVHFYRNDPLTGKYLDDYLEIIILSENGSNKTHIEAPEYKLPVQKKETPVKKTETEAPAANDKEEVKATEVKQVKNATDAKEADHTVAPETKVPQYEETAEPVKEEVPVTAQTADSAVLLKDAQVLYNEKEYAAALKKLNQFFELSTDNRDEALYLKGQILEAKSEVRDIKGAIDAYISLTKNYPASKLWDSANKRVIYLKRFYLEVR